MATYSVVEIPSEAGNPEWGIVRRGDEGAEKLLPTTYGSDAEAQQVAEQLRIGEPLIVSGTAEARGEGRATATGVALHFVSIDHTSPAYKEAEEALEALDSAIKGSNDLFANADERIAVSNEVQGVLGIIRGGVVRVGAVLSSVKDSGIVAYLAKECANALIREYAARALKALWTLIVNLLSS